MQQMKYLGFKNSVTSCNTLSVDIYYTIVYTIVYTIHTIVYNGFLRQVFKYNLKSGLTSRT